jgi:hypothetical protein
MLRNCPDAFKKPENGKRPSECVSRSFQKRRQIVRKHEQTAKTALERTIDFVGENNES